MSDDRFGEFDRVVPKVRFVVTAKGSLDIAPKYEMDVSIAPEGITIGGLGLSWNDAYAAFEAAVTYARASQSLFPGKKR